MTVLATIPDRRDCASGRRALVKASVALRKANRTEAWAIVSLVRRGRGIVGRRMVDVTLLTGRTAADLRAGLAYVVCPDGRGPGVLDLWVEAVSPGLDSRDVLDD